MTQQEQHQLLSSAYQLPQFHYAANNWDHSLFIYCVSKYIPSYSTRAELNNVNECMRAR
jgi:hypothetical protein